MEEILKNLIDSLKSVNKQLKDDTVKAQLLSTLHSAEKLPDWKSYKLASEALDLLKETQLILEPGHLILADHFLGYTQTKCLVVVVDLHIPDLLSTGPQTVSQLASVSGSRPDRLGQVLLTLHNNGIFSYNASDATYSNNHISTLLQSSHWTQWHNWVSLYGNEFYDMARGIPDSLKADATRNPAQIFYDTDDSMFSYFTQQGWIEKFHRTLSGGAIAQAPGIVEDYPWEELETTTVMDVGGGGGGLIAALLRRHTKLQGAILDLPHVVEQAKRRFHGDDAEYKDVASRVKEEDLVGGDFMVEVPACEVYTMRWCLHDWDDEKAVVILKTIRKAIKTSKKSRLVVLEAVLSDGHSGRLSRYADLNMMVAVGGRERGEKQWKDLAARSGWMIRKIYTLRHAWPCAIEFVPIEPGQVVSEMRFLEPWDGTRGNPYVRVAPDEGYDRTNIEWRDYAISIADARPTKNDFQLDVHGFAYLDDAISSDIITALRKNEDDVVKQLYYPHVEQLVKKITGAQRVIIFDHTQRKRRLALGKAENSDGKEQPATMVHCDQSEKGAIRRLEMNIQPDEDVKLLLEGRVQMINIWRPLTEPVEDWPLATMDYQSVNVNDFHPCDLLKGAFEERGQTVTFTHNDDQKWYYLKNQMSNELTAIKVWDNEDGGSKFCAHAAFQHPDTPPNVQPRESVEVRCLALHDKKSTASCDS